MRTFADSDEVFAMVLTCILCIVVAIAGALTGAHVERKHIAISCDRQHEFVYEYGNATLKYKCARVSTDVVLD